MPSLDSLLKMGAEAAMMFGADNRKDIYQGIDRLDAAVVNSATADILADSDLDFDNPATFAPVISKLNQLSPGLGNTMGKTLYSISNERMRAAAEAAKNAAMGRSYLSQSKNFDAQAALNQAKANTQKLGTEYVTQAVNRGEGTNLQGARTLFGDGPVPLSPQQQYDIEAKKAAEKKAAAIEAAKIKAVAKRNNDNGGLKVPRVKPLGDDELQEILHLGVPSLQQMYPSLEIDPTAIDDSIRLAIEQAYTTGMKITNDPYATKADIIRAGLEYLKNKNKMAVTEKTIPGQPAEHWWQSDTPETKMKGLTYPAPPPQPPKVAPPENQQPDNSNYPSVFNQPPADKVVAETVQWIKKNPDVTKQQIVLQMMNRYKAMGLSKEETKARINAFINQGQ